MTASSSCVTSPIRSYQLADHLTDATPTPIAEGPLSASTTSIGDILMPAVLTLLLAKE
jgi:hypothetical protein